MGLSRYLMLAQDEIADTAEEATDSETGATGGLLGDLSSNFRILIMVVAAVILYFIMRELYAVLINKEWHPANAKLLSLSILFTLLCTVFTVLFLGQVLLVVIIISWVLLVIFILFAWLKRRR
ncbi:MAG: hypothetical protein QG641_1243 [Candidatus Poribacteria bacterium]|nr:hypothetical protein [Candidatus Poribacteria bacterium]MDQ1327958.1 hypothetical protein [Candidatus Poribacteria bacterium]